MDKGPHHPRFTPPRMALACVSAAQTDHASRRLRTLRDRLRQKSPAGIALEELSMGMSGDFEMAIKEGATVVRVGQAIFGARVLPAVTTGPAPATRPQHDHHHHCHPPPALTCWPRWATCSCCIGIAVR